MYTLNYTFNSICYITIYIYIYMSRVCVCIYTIKYSFDVSGISSLNPAFLIEVVTMTPQRERDKSLYNFGPTIRRNKRDIVVVHALRSNLVSGCGLVEAPLVGATKIGKIGVHVVSSHQITGKDLDLSAPAKHRRCRLRSIINSCKPFTSRGARRRPTVDRPGPKQSCS